MRTLIYLFRNRLQHRPLTFPWIKQWGKRVITLPVLLRYLCKTIALRARGAHIHPSAVLSSVEVHGNATNLSIGSHSSVGKACLQCHAPLTIGACVVINDGARILTGSHDIESPDYDHVFKPIVIEDYAWIASGAILLQGVTIGRRAIVAAGAVVARDVPQDMVVAGNPARIVKNRGMRELRYKPSRFFAPYEAWLGKMPSI